VLVMVEGTRAGRRRARGGAVARHRMPALMDFRLQAYGAWLGLGLLARRRLRRGLRYVVVPVNYWRSLEYRLALEEGRLAAGERVLDVGSPKLLALWAADRLGAHVTATDIEPYFLEELSLLRAIRRVPEERLGLAVEDGRRLSFGDGSFDKVYSLSVLEHIPNGGDSACVTELARVLAPGGRCVLTVPFWPTSRTDWRPPDFYWADASVDDATGRVFYQRRYSEVDLWERLIDPSGLRLAGLRFVGDRVDAGGQRELCEFLPPVTGPLQPALARLLMTRPSGDWRSLRKPLCALVVLEKPTTAGVG
jgi:SAM-dependent methyltransferase